MSKIQTPHEYKCDLDVGPLEVKLREPLMHQDALADVFRVRVLRSGKDVSITGMVARGFMYSEVTRETIPLPGVVEGSFASVTLIDKCYAVPGEANLSIQLQEGDVCHTLANIHFDLRRTGTNVVTDPAGVLPTLPSLLSKITALEQTTTEARQTISDVKAEGSEAVEQTMAAAADARLAAQEISGSSASPISKSATGKFIEIDNAANKPLAGLRLYGKTTQDGTPTPDAPVELVNVGAGGSIGVKAMGKNLADVRLLQSVKTLYGRLVAIAPMTLFAGITYTISFDTENTGIQAYVNGAAIIAMRTFTMDGTRKVFQVTPESDFAMQINPNETTVDFINRLSPKSDVESGMVSNVQIEIGSTVTAYEPYTNGGSLTASTPNGLPGIPVTSGGNYTDSTGQQWICDEVDFGRGVHVQRVGVRALDGTENWSAGSSAGAWNLYIGDAAMISSGSNNAYCTHYKYHGTSFANMDNLSCKLTITSDGLGEYMAVKDTRYGSLDAWKAALAANPITVMYILASPIETPLSASELAAYRAMATFNPETFIYSDSDVEMTVDYIGETDKFVHEVIDDRAAPPIIPTATGETVTVSDSAERPLAGLRLYGKTTQDGTPTPTSPIDLVNIGNGGSIEVSVKGKNLLDIANIVFNTVYEGITITSLGNGFSISGTANKNMVFTFPINYTIPAGRYTYHARNIGVEASTTLYFLTNGGDAGHIPLETNYSKKTFNTEYAITAIKIYIYSGKSLDVRMYPMLTVEDTDTREEYKDGGSLTASTPDGLPGIPVTSGGNYTDENGQQWVCDEIDFGRGVYVQRCMLMDNFTYSATKGDYHIYECATNTPMLGGGNAVGMCNVTDVYEYSQAEKTHFYVSTGGTGVVIVPSTFDSTTTPIKVISALATPIETALSASELAAFRAMTSQYPNTTVCNDSGAGMGVDYVADTKTYIDKKLADIASALLAQ